VGRAGTKCQHPHQGNTGISERFQPEHRDLEAASRYGDFCNYWLAEPLPEESWPAALYCLLKELDERCGVVHCARQSQVRRPRKRAYWYRRVIEENGI